MNRADARGVFTPKGWRADYRLVWKAKYESVRFLRNDGVPGPIMYFTTELEAELVAWRRKSQLEQPVIRSAKPDKRFSPARRAAELYFFTPKKPAAERAGE